MGFGGKEVTGLKRIGTKAIKHELPLGFSAALFFLWLPLMTPHMLSGWRKQQTLWDLRGLPILLTVAAGFSLMLLVERFSPRASLRRHSLWAGAILMLLTPACLFWELPSMAGLLILFLSACCTAILLLPVFQSLHGNEDPQPVCALLFAPALGGGLAAAGQPLLQLAERMRPQLCDLLTVTAAGALLTGGLFASRRLTQQPAAAPGLYVTVGPARGIRPAAVRCIGYLLCAMGALLMIARSYAGYQTEQPPWHGLTPLLLLIAAGLLTAFLLWGRRWFFLYGVTLGVLLGVLTRPDAVSGTLFVHAFFLFLGIAGLGFLAAESLHELAAPINRIYALGLGGAVCLLFCWLAADPGQLLWIGERLRRPAAEISLTASLLILLPLLMGFPVSHTRETYAETRAEEPVRPVQEGNRPVNRDQLAVLLTATEKRVYKLILLGYSNQQMADELIVSINTIKFHVKNILAKAGAAKKTQLVGLYLHTLNDHGEKAAGTYPAT